MSAGQWTSETKRQFLDHLSASCNISASLTAVGMTSPSLYRLRARSAAFREAWDKALAEGYARLETMMLERALNGERREVTRDGQTVIETIPCSERLALTLLGLHRRRVTAIRQAADDAETAREDHPAARRRIAARLEKLAARALGTIVADPIEEKDSIAADGE